MTSNEKLNTEVQKLDSRMKLEALIDKMRNSGDTRLHPYAIRANALVRAGRDQEALEEITAARQAYPPLVSVGRLLLKTGAAKSHGEARRLIEGNAVHIESMGRIRSFEQLVPGTSKLTVGKKEKKEYQLPLDIEHEQ